jgi:hypothetical protein
LCHCTKSLRDSGEVGLVLSTFPREESLLANEASSLEDRGIVDLIEHAASHDRTQNDPQLHTKRFQHDHITTKNSDKIRSHAEHEDYLDEVIETVSAQQPETFQFFENQFALCCLLKLLVKLIA